MPKKRKHEKDIEEIQRKFIKYSKKMEKIQRRPPSPVLTPSGSPTPSVTNSTIFCEQNNQGDSEVQEVNLENDKELEEETLDEEVLKLLGEAPINEKYGPSIYKELASRWASIIKNGLSKESRIETKNKYLPPENCKVIDAPKLNLEAQAAVTDVVIKRDKAICNKQNQIGCALTALALAFVNLAKNKENLQTINYISDAARLLCDHQHQESVTRRHFILQGLDQSTRDSIKDTEIDQWLFGESFSEKLKASKAIKKSGQEISINKPKKPQNFNNHQQKKSLNFKGPVVNLTRNRTYQSGPQRNYQTYKRPVPLAQSAPQSRKTYAQNKAPLRPVNNH